jgi:nifR3 family TIM-barrel protein
VVADVLTAPPPTPSVASLRLGSLVVDPPVVLAPMAGVTNTAFRRLCAEQGAGLYVSEMVSARALVENNAKTARMLEFSDHEPIRSIQLYGVEPTSVELATRRLVDEVGVAHVDLNMGCPVPKVTRLGGGAALPLRSRLFADLVSAAVRAARGVPVTVKMRMGADAGRLSFLRAGRIAADCGVAAVALHARTAEELYSGRAHWEAIAALKASLPDIPVLGNGDIWTAADAVAMLAATGADGVVIGRGCLGRPWLFGDLVDALAGRPIAAPPRLGDVVTMMRRHVRLLVEHYGDERTGICDFRKHVGWYLTGYPAGASARRALTAAGSVAALDAELASLDPSIELPMDAAGLPRGPSHGPRRVTLPEGWLEADRDPAPPTAADLMVSGG